METAQPILPIPFGALLKQQRLRAGLTQEELAERAGLSVRALIYLERGAHRPYRDTVRRLAGALGLEPGTRAVLEAAAQAAGSGQAPRVGLSTHGLPAQTTILIGREQAVAEVVALLGRAGLRLLTLTGPAGVGKTRLGARVAEELADRFADGVWFVALAPVADPDLVPATIAQALGVVEDRAHPLRETLLSFLRERHLLLLLDNFEHLSAAATLLADLLGACPLLTVLVTSRSALRLRAEQEYVVPPLPVPEATGAGRSSVRVVSAAAIAQVPSVALFVTRAQAVRPEFRLTDAEAPAVAEICRRLDGLPLALELAAAWTRLLSPADLLARLAQHMRILTGGPRDAPERQQTLRAALDWSYTLLAPSEQALFRRLSVFAGGWTIGAAETIGADLDGDVLSGMAALMEQSLLVRRDGSDGVSRLHLLETLRAYGLEQLAAHGETDDVRRRHALHYLGLAESLLPALDGAEPEPALATFRQEQDNLRAAVAWCLGPTGDAELGRRLVAALWRFWYEADHVDEGLATIWRFWTGADHVDAKLATIWRFSAGADHVNEGLAALRRTLAASADQSPSPERAEVLRGAAVLAVSDGDLRAARLYAEESRRLWQALGDPCRAAEAQVELGSLALQFGDRDGARSLLEESVAVLRRDKAVPPLVRALDWLAQVFEREGRHADAYARFAEALTLLGPDGDAHRRLNLTSCLLNSSLLLGHADVAEMHRAECRTLSTLLPEDHRLAREIQNLGWILYSHGRLDEAAACFERSLTLHRAHANDCRIAWNLTFLGDVARAREDYERATACYAEGILLFRYERDSGGVAAILHNQGHLALVAGDASDAAALFTESLRRFHELGFAWSIADCLAGLGGVAALQGRPRRAARLFGATQALHNAVETGRWADTANRLAWERNVARARMQLDSVAWDAAWAEGSVMDFDAAVAYALSAGQEDDTTG